MKNGIILSAVMAALCASGETVKTATQPWVRSYVATNRTDVSGKADATNVYTKAETDAKIVELAPTPGDYATVSNRAMSALQSHQSLRPSTNYTDEALSAFAETGTVARATVYGTPTRWTDPTGCVWEVVAAPGTGYEDWICSGVPGGYFVLGVEPLPESTWRLDLYDNDIDSFYAFGAADAAYLVFDVDGAMVEARAKFTMTNLVGRVALTDDIPDVSGYATPADVTAAIREQSLGGIWDRDLEVWWTPIMENGALRYIATTNVNLNAGN